jgi:hypothetical protein
MKVKALKDLNLGGTGIVAVTYKKGDIFDIPDTQPIGGKIVFYTEMGTSKKLPLILGEDVLIVVENPTGDVKQIYDKDIQKAKIGSYMFVGGTLLLTYLVFKIIKSK